MNVKLKAALLIFASIVLVAWLNAQEVEPPCGAQYTIPYTEVFEPLTLTLPNTTPFNQIGGPRLVVEKVVPGPLVSWAWLSCDQVKLPVGSEITVKLGTEYTDFNHLGEWMYTVNPDGTLTSHPKR